jgi:hypothetical protein
VQQVVDELNLSSAGLTSRESVVKVGNLLACDWLVSGTIVQVDSGTYLWTKIISVRDGILRDLNVIPYRDSDSTDLAGKIAKFIEQAPSRTQPTEFIALGPFVSLSAPLGGQREDWVLRIKTLIEKKSFSAGFGVTDIGAINPIFQERRLEAAGLKSGADRVQLQSDFWLVDAGCRWLDTNANQLFVGLRVQRVGGPEQIFLITNSANRAIENDILAAFEKALANTNRLANPGPNAESELLAARGMELATRRSPFPSGRTVALTSHSQRNEFRQQHLADRDQLIATYRRTLMSDPENVKAASMLSLALLNHEDADQRADGKKFCDVLLKSRNEALVNIARARLAQIDQFSKYREALAESERTARKDYHYTKQRYEENPSDMEAKCDYGEVLLGMQYLNLRELGRKLLHEIAASDSNDQAERARQLLAKPESTQSIPRNPNLNGKQ